MVLRGLTSWRDWRGGVRGDFEDRNGNSEHEPVKSGAGYGSGKGLVGHGRRQLCLTMPESGIGAIYGS